MPLLMLKTELKMDTNLAISTPAFSNTIEGFGTITLRELNLTTDTQTIHNWVTQPYAQYWGMLDSSLEDVHEEYQKLTTKKDYEVFIGLYQNEPIFLMEKYKAASDRIAEYYQTEETDYGMHILVAPPTQKIPNFTWNVFSTVLAYFFAQPNIERVVVEPDIRNEKIHVLNKKAGFKYVKEIQLPEKKAGLAFCTKKDFIAAKNNITKPAKKHKTGTSFAEHLTPENFTKANRALVKKAISEFAHELVLQPTLVKNTVDIYQLVSDDQQCTYQFKANRKALDHWDINETSIVKTKNEEILPLNAIDFIVEFRKTLGIPDHLLPVYLEEILSTLSGAAYKIQHQIFTAKELAKTNFQAIEHAMTEGHPCFVANNGRLGFDAPDYFKYAPETDQPFQLIWLAGNKNKTTYTATLEHNYNSLINNELGTEKFEAFNTHLKSLGLQPNDYLFIPVHPWQWHNKIVQVFAADIAQQNLVFLGKGEDYFSAQQSIRTLYNISDPNKMYTKTALSILNMGFMRGLSPYYMQSTPHITNWITSLLENDSYLKENGFEMLGEVATIGFQNTYFEALGKTNAHNKMLSALWRESPHTKITENQELMTMASFLHLDNDGNSFLAELIKASGISTEDWIKNYLKAYLAPLLHCFYTYEFVFMPHGENIIMVMENNAPKHILMKDITEEVIVFNEEMELPEHAKRLFTKTNDGMKVLCIFTDVFDCIFRFITPILEKHLNFSENAFWELVANCIYEYQAEHPQLVSKFKQYDLFVPEFDRCCLNRLQLKNTTQMLQLADPIESLELVGVLENPLNTFKR